MTLSSKQIGSIALVIVLGVIGMMVVNAGHASVRRAADHHRGARRRAAAFDERRRRGPSGLDGLGDAIRRARTGERPSAPANGEPRDRARLRGARRDGGARSGSTRRRSTTKQADLAGDGADPRGGHAAPQRGRLDAALGDRRDDEAHQGHDDRGPRDRAARRDAHLERRGVVELDPRDDGDERRGRRERRRARGERPRDGELDRGDGVLDQGGRQERRRAVAHGRRDQLVDERDGRLDRPGAVERERDGAPVGGGGARRREGRRGHPEDDQRDLPHQGELAGGRGGHLEPRRRGSRPSARS